VDRVDWFDQSFASVSPVPLKDLGAHMTAQERGLLGLILVCPHREDKVFAARGFRHAANNYGAAQALCSGLHKKAGLCKQKWPHSLRWLDYFHHLYR
jgi:hypothetical protein